MKPIACLTLLLLLLAAGAQAHYLENPDFKNLNVSFYFPERGMLFDRATADDLEYLNVRMVRMEFIGGHDRDRTIDYGPYDLIVDEAGKRGISLLGLLAYQIFDANHDDKTEWSQPSFRKRYIDRVREIVSHYHDREFPIRHWEIWHQPDRADEDFDVRIEPEPFAQLLIEAYQAIKSIDPGATVVFGGISPSGHQYEESYLRDVYQSQPMMDFRAEHGHSPFDVVAVHPNQHNYASINPGLGVVLIDRIRAVMNEFGDTDLKVWITELGWNSRYVGIPQQATLLNQSFHYLETLTDPDNPHNGPFVERVFWFQYENYGVRGDWGLRTIDRATRKASYFAFRDLTPAGREPGAPRPGELQPVWNASTDDALAVQVLDDDLLTGMIPEIISGYLHDANTGVLADLTNGLFHPEPLSVLLVDYAIPSIHLRYTFPEPVDITEVRSFAGHPRDWGNRAFQNIDIRVNGTHGIDELKTGRFGQISPTPVGGVSVVRWMPRTNEQYVARNVTTLDLLYYPVSTNYQHDFLDPWKPAEDPTATLLDKMRDFDGREPAFAATLLKEIDVLGHVSP